MKLVKSLFVPVVALVSAPVFADPVDYSSLTSAIDLSTTSAALLVAAASLMGVYILWKGATMIIGAFRGR